MKQNNDKQDFINVMDFCISMAPLRERKGKPQIGKLSVIHVSDKRFIHRIKNFHKAIRIDI